MSPSILIIRGGAIGDFILTLPVFSALRERFPGVRLEVLGYPHIGKLALAGGLVDAVRPIEARALASFFVPQGTLPEELTVYFSRFAIIISYLYDPDFTFQTNLRGCTSAEFIAGPHRPEPNEKTHATEVFLRPLQQLAIVGANPMPRLRLVAAEGTTAATALPPPSPQHRRLAVHPGSGSQKKNWPLRHWVTLLEEARQLEALDLLLVGGEADGDQLDELAKHWPPARLELARSLPLTQLAYRLQGSTAFVGHDSGITHLAAALGLPGLALWAETDPAVWRPRGDAIKMMQGPAGLSTLPVAEVLDRLHKLLAAGEDA